MYYLSKQGSKKETVEKVSKDKAIRYKIVEEAIDLKALRAEKEGLEEQLAVEKPSDEELIEQGKGIDPYYVLDREGIEKRIADIDIILSEK